MHLEETNEGEFHDARFPRLQGELCLPRAHDGWGVLVLHGSSGRPDVYAARLFAETGAIAFAQRWFGAAGLPAEIRDVPLELFIEGVDMLVARGCSRIAVFGRSRGAEAALLLAVHDARVRAVFGVSPSHVAWAGTGLDGRPSWTRNGEAIPFVAYDLGWWSEPRAELVEYRAYHDRSLALDAGVTERARIPVERTEARMVLVAGGADALWASLPFAQALQQRRRAHGMDCVLAAHPDAGHRVLLPGELTPRSTLHAHGGTDAADGALGLAAWGAIRACLAAPA